MGMTQSWRKQLLSKMFLIQLYLDPDARTAVGLCKESDDACKGSKDACKEPKCACSE